ncbi:hypothetical protein RvY_19343 [Ramazzottius varieornatus]|uniref:Secreted protein n=1 Tax=Ramazzottius varieornatus TaxID=947166 RepID=A0A1D1W937_RAMVA|nr:hypothetical protein RvY_19343 [Ramazzottius varieornatus]
MIVLKALYRFVVLMNCSFGVCALIDHLRIPTIVCSTATFVVLHFRPVGRTANQPPKWIRMCFSIRTQLIEMYCSFLPYNHFQDVDKFIQTVCQVAHIFVVVGHSLSLRHLGI